MTYLLNTYRLSRYLIGRNKINRVLKKVQSGSTNDQHFLFNAEWEGEGKEKWFIKQLINLDSNERFNLINEASATRVISEVPLLADYSPRFIHYDAVHKILITEFPIDYSSIADDATVLEPSLLMDGNLLEVIGSMMASFHIYLTEKVTSSLYKLPFYFFKPPLLTNNIAFLNPLLTNELLSPLIREWLSSIVLRPSVSQHLLALSQSWRTDSIIHGDATINNILFHSTDKKHYKLKLCDWEFAGWGDPDWDSANFFQGLLNAYMAKTINYATLLEAGNRYFAAYKATYPLSTKFPIFDEWFTKVLRLAAVSLLERLLGNIIRTINIKPQSNDLHSHEIEFLFTRILINPHVLTSF